MAELKVNDRQIAQPNAPDISGLAKAVGNLGQAKSQVFGALADTTGDYIQANRTIEEKSLLAGASTAIERAKIDFENNPQLTMEGVQQFGQMSQEIIDGYAQNIKAPSSLRTFLASTKEIQNKSVTGLMGHASKIAYSNELRELSLNVKEYQGLVAQNLYDGDIDSAVKNADNLNSMLQSMGTKGFSAAELTAAKESTESLYLATQGMMEVKNSSPDKWEAISKAYSLSPTDAHRKASGQINAYIKMLQRFRKQGSDIAEPLKNITTGSAYLNRNLSAKIAQATEDHINGVSNTDSNIVTNDGLPNLPSGILISPNGKKPQPISYDSQKNSLVATFEDAGGKVFDYYKQPDGLVSPGVEREGGSPSAATEQTASGELPRRSLKITSYVNDLLTSVFIDNKIASSEGKIAPVEKPSLFQMAETRLIVGSPNATALDNQLSGAFHAGSGAQCVEAMTAINRIEQQNPDALILDDETDMMYSLFKIEYEAGRRDVDNIIKETRDVTLKLNRVNLKENKALYRSSLGLSGGKPLKNLTKLFSDFTGIDPDKTDSRSALIDFNRILETKFLLADGKLAPALDATKREMTRTYGADSLSNGSYVKYPSSIMMSGLEPAMRNNIFLKQVVSFADKNKNIELPEKYNNIKTMPQEDKATINVAYEPFMPHTPPTPFTQLIKLYSNESPENAPILITQNIPGVGKVSGKLLLKNIPLTAQNDLGEPIWAAYIVDSVGREFPINDEKSPYQQTLILRGMTAKEFVPDYADYLEQEKFTEMYNKILINDARKLYSRISLTPVVNYLARKEYVGEEKNITYAKKRARAALGIAGKKE